MRHDSFVITLPLPAPNLRERSQLLAGLCAPLLSGQEKAWNAGQVGLKNKQDSRSVFGHVSLAWKQQGDSKGRGWMLRQWLG